MARDIAPYELPDGFCYDAADMLCDYAGKIRKRGGTTSPSASNRTATVENLLGFRSNGLDAVTGLFGSSGKTAGNVYVLDKTTGAATSMGTYGSAAGIVAKPFQHGNYGVLPIQPAAQATGAGNGPAFIGGGTGAAFVVTAATVAANNNRVTAVAPTSFVAGHLGSIIQVANATNVYVGRIVEVTSSSAVRVEPTPRYAIAGASGNVVSLFLPDYWGGNNVGARYGVSFQNRLVFGYTSVAPSASIANGFNPEPNRLRWTLLPTEATPQISLAGTFVYDGDNFLYRGAFLGDTATPYYNYQDIPSLGGMTGLATVGDGQLIIFGPTSTFRLTGQLTTNTVANNALNYSVDQISANVGCVSSKSIQYARGGLIWAGYDNIYEYSGSKLSPLLNGRNQRYFQDLLRGGATIYGSAYAVNKNHYYLSLSGIQGGLMFDLDNLATTRTTGPTTQIFDSAPDPVDPTKLWSVRWWDTTTTAPTMTKGQLIQMDPIWLPTSANKNDGDGTAVLFDFQSSSQPTGALATNKLAADVGITYDSRGTGSPTATLRADTKLNTNDAAYVTVTAALPDTGSAATTHVYPVGNLLPDGPSLEVRITGNAVQDTFELLGLDLGNHQGTEGYAS
ncbi:MAG: hypothetical protein H0X39_00235 [Actinobacteria bacterium]|nr:hypothetical protein [Actinomycetota bacterium]